MELSGDPVDLRGFEVWERAAKVLERSDDLGASESFVFVTEINPRALVNRLNQVRADALDFHVLRVSDEQWRVTVRRSGETATERGAGAVFTRNPFLAAFSQDSQRAIEAASRERQGRKGETIAGAGAPREHVSVLFDGTLGIFGGGSDRERMLFQVYPYELFGALEFIDGGFSIGRTTVLSRTAAFLDIPNEAVRLALETEPRAWRVLARFAAQHTRALSAELTAQVQQPILARVAASLLPYAAPERDLCPALPPLQTMTQTQIAAAAGTVKEVAARAIAELERREAIRRERGHIAYLNRSRLLEIADRY